MSSVQIIEESRGPEWETLHRWSVANVPNSKAEIAVFGDSIMRKFSSIRANHDLWMSEVGERDNILFTLVRQNQASHVAYNTWLSPAISEDYCLQHWDQ